MNARISHTQQKTQQRRRRHARIRATVRGTAERPRLAVYKSNAYIYAQLIDDTSGTTLAGVTSKALAAGKPRTEQARAVGEAIAKKAKENNVTEVVFDRGGFVFTGIIKTLADTAREAGLKF